jgi:hypothetical protein
MNRARAGVAKGPWLPRPFGLTPAGRPLGVANARRVDGPICALRLDRAACGGQRGRDSCLPGSHAQEHRESCFRLAAARLERQCNGTEHRFKKCRIADSAACRYRQIDVRVAASRLKTPLEGDVVRPAKRSGRQATRASCRSAKALPPDRPLAAPRPRRRRPRPCRWPGCSRRPPSQRR